MRTLCMNIVEAAGGFWPYAGWGLFLAVMFIPFVMYSSAVLAIWYLSVLLLFIWWIIDAASQMTPVWMILVGIVVFAFGLVVRIMLIASWVVYWTKVRE